jgi:PilZ domain
MTIPEQRRSTRYLLRLPVRFRCVEKEVPELEFCTETTNVSQYGLLMESPLRLKLGSSLSVTLRVPTELSGSPFLSYRCRGRVVHEQKLADGTLGYGVEIHQAMPHLQSQTAQDARTEIAWA